MARSTQSRPTTLPMPSTKSRWSSSAPPSASPAWRLRWRSRSPCCISTSSCHCGVSSSCCRRIRPRIFGLAGRGSLAQGSHADVTIFDPKQEVDLRRIAIEIKIQEHAVRWMEFHWQGHRDDCGWQGRLQGIAPGCRSDAALRDLSAPLPTIQKPIDHGSTRMRTDWLRDS